MVLDLVDLAPKRLAGIFVFARASVVGRRRRRRTNRPAWYRHRRSARPSDTAAGRRDVTWQEQRERGEAKGQKRQANWDTENRRNGDRRRHCRVSPEFAARIEPVDRIAEHIPVQVWLSRYRRVVPYPQVLPLMRFSPSAARPGRASPRCGVVPGCVLDRLHGLDGSALAHGGARRRRVSQLRCSRSSSCSTSRSASSSARAFSLCVGFTLVDGARSIFAGCAMVCTFFKCSMETRV